MKTKYITALVAFFAAFVVSVGLVVLFTPFTPIDESQVTVVKQRYNLQTARDITNLLRQDINNGLERREDSDSDEADNVAEYADKSAGIDDSGLPIEFQAVWHQHMKAWHDYAEFLRDVENPQLRKNFSDEQINRMAFEHNSRINTTWYEVLRTGRRYGAVIPANAY